MKKIIILAFFVSGYLFSFSQSISDVASFVRKSGYDVLKAKDMIDKCIANPKNVDKSDAWYYKGYIYNALSKADNTKTSCTDCRMEGFNALKKCRELDSKDILLKLEQYSSFFNIYGGYFDDAVKAYNDKNYKGAFDNFKNAGMVEDYIVQNNIEGVNGSKFPALDTSLVQNTALSAKLAGDTASTVAYYKKMTDAELADDQYLIAYEFQADYYRHKNDLADFNAIVTKGRKIFPKEPFWNAIEIEQVSQTGTKLDVFKKYDELIKEDSDNYVLSYNYCVELYNYVFENDDKTVNTALYVDPLMNQLKKTIAIKSVGEDNMLMARALYNSSYDNGDNARKIKSTKPEDVKKRKALADKANEEVKEAIPYALEAEKYYSSLPTLKGPDKINYRATLSMLQGLYEAQNNTVKTTEYANKIKAL